MKTPAELLQDEIACYKKPRIKARPIIDERQVKEAVRYLKNYRNEVAPKKRMFRVRHF